MFRRILLLLLLIALASVNAQIDDADIRKKSKRPLAELKAKYEELPPIGKFGVAGVGGFIGSRVALKTFIGAAKVAGATFIATEVLSASGLMEDMPDFVNDNVENVKSAKNRVLREADKFRKGVRTALRKERMAAFGFAGGAFMGIVM